MGVTKKWRENIDKFKANGSKIHQRVRQEIIRPKRSWWLDASFRIPESGIPAEELDRMRHNTQGIQSSDNF